MEEYELYGGDIPEEIEEGEATKKGEASGGDDSSNQNVEEMKKRFQELDDESAALRDMQERTEKEMQVQSKEEVDSRSVYVGNVDYSCTPEEVQLHFQACGTVNRVTILTDKFGQPKGYAYVEFLEVEAVQNAIGLNESQLHGRPLKVSPKRTNIPGMKQYRGRRFDPQGHLPPRGYMPHGFGKVPRYGRQMRYRPYF